MKFWTKLLFLLLAGTIACLSSCSSNAFSKSPYFGIDDHNKRFVPRELQEDRH